MCAAQDRDGDASASRRTAAAPRAATLVETHVAGRPSSPAGLEHRSAGDIGQITNQAPGRATAWCVVTRGPGGQAERRTIWCSETGVETNHEHAGALRSSSIERRTAACARSSSARSGVALGLERPRVEGAPHRRRRAADCAPGQARSVGEPVSRVHATRSRLVPHRRTNRDHVARVVRVPDVSVRRVDEPRSCSRSTLERTAVPLSRHAPRLTATHKY